MRDVWIEYIFVFWEGFGRGKGKEFILKGIFVVLIIFCYIKNLFIYLGGKKFIFNSSE